MLFSQTTVAVRCFHAGTAVPAGRPTLCLAGAADVSLPAERLMCGSRADAERDPARHGDLNSAVWFAREVQRRTMRSWGAGKRVGFDTRV